MTVSATVKPRRSLEEMIFPQIDVSPSIAIEAHHQMKLQSCPPFSPNLANISSNYSTLPSRLHQSSNSAMSGKEERNKWRRLGTIGRYTLGIILLLITVFLWTASNFLTSTIFADNTYSKPFFITYINTTFFMLTLVPFGAKRLYIALGSKCYKHKSCLCTSLLCLFLRNRGTSEGAEDERSSFLHYNQDGDRPEISRQYSRSSLSSSSKHSRIHWRQYSLAGSTYPTTPLTLRATARLSLQFSLLWFCANYFVATCLKYTTVASSTILSSTSSVWTLIVGALMHIETFTSTKLLGVLCSFLGIVITSFDDLTQPTPPGNLGTFPYKSFRETALGDFLAFMSAILYGVYSILLKKQIGDESRVNMPLFFGLVGFFNVTLLWPGLVILHFTGAEPFVLPPTSRIWTIVVLNAVTSLVSDLCWAFATLLASPLVVTVGLSLTIPLSLIGQFILQGQRSSAEYWVGAAIVFVSFLIVNSEERREGKIIAEDEQRLVRNEDVVGNDDEARELEP